MNTGWDQRLAILRQVAENKILSALRTYAWNASIEQEVENGEYLVITAERGRCRNSIALLYSCATDNEIYKRLGQQVGHIFAQAGLYNVEQYAVGLTTPVSSVDDFATLLAEWNEASTEGKFERVPEDAQPIAICPAAYRMLSSEEPIQAIWLRLRQFQSITLAMKLIEARAQGDGIALDNCRIRSKAEGVAYSLRNASDYFQTREVRNLSQRILNLYYGSMAFATAEMLALPGGPGTLAEIERQTKSGHGLYEIDGASSGLEHLVVGVINKGFFPAWMKSLDADVSTFPEKKVSEYAKLPTAATASWLSIEHLFASIPEISDLFNEIFQDKPRWMIACPEQGATADANRIRTYVRLIDNSGRLKKEDVAQFPGPISQIAAVQGAVGSHFRVAITHSETTPWWSAIHLHSSPFQRQAFILPIFEVVNQYRALCLVLLYGLSIVVRYRPSVWRLAQEGELDHMRVLIDAFLTVVERVLPEQFLETITGQRVFVGQPARF